MGGRQEGGSHAPCPLQHPPGPPAGKLFNKWKFENSPLSILQWETGHSFSGLIISAFLN